MDDECCRYVNECVFGESCSVGGCVRERGHHHESVAAAHWVALFFGHPGGLLLIKSLGRSRGGNFK